MADEIRGRSLFRKLRLYLMLTIAATVVIVIFQNTEDVETSILFWTLRMPRAALLAVAVLAGFAGGVIWAGFQRRKKQ